MVTTTLPWNDPRSTASEGAAFDGVVRVSVEGYYGSGVLLQGGRAVLTAAHLFERGLDGVRVRFEVGGQVWTQTAREVLVHPEYDAEDNNRDLALVWLEGAAPVGAARHGLYREADEVGQVFTLAGYGLPGTGEEGAWEDHDGEPLRLQAGNRFDADVGALVDAVGGSLAWAPEPGTQLIADFDNGASAHDASGILMGRYDQGLGPEEGMIAPGDSGGPALIGDRVAGIASYLASLSRHGVEPDVDGLANSSFGEVMAFQRVSREQEWIDRALRSRHPDAPTRPGEVEQALTEGDDGTSLAWFLLEFTGVRETPDAWVSVDFETRDGTAEAGSDYLPVSGRLVLYPGEDHAAIPVEVVGDTRPEPDETFHLAVFNPEGGGFGPGVEELIATRTIVDEDGFWG
ncbi:Calx-beta domain-containing protein [Ectothiorhodospira mobilis]|uniref:Calx-beta domain-containing protein n=1 Tax=Ectothiorhodospira mobilis TaxID=195064 RepID=UPI001EE79404|nr:Calx-beta domain-containing protein [Ectothiorhodospira mobilis]MCG5534657.1 trypsin-like serine protease [Ectothiorhodospira mobilis]